MHGILNILGWGVFLPSGVIIARYFKVHPFPKDKWWFYLHVFCQSVGYVLGTTGWAIGLWLGHASRHYTFRTHRILAIFIFTFATLQVTLFLPLISLINFVFLYIFFNYIILFPLKFEVVLILTFKFFFFFFLILIHQI